MIDEDTTDAFMDAPRIRYRHGSVLEMTARQGFDTNDLGTLATQINDRRRAAGLPELPPLPPPIDH